MWFTPKDLRGLRCESPSRGELPQRPITAHDPRPGSTLSHVYPWSDREKERYEKGKKIICHDARGNPADDRAIEIDTDPPRWGFFSFGCGDWSEHAAVHDSSDAATAAHDASSSSPITACNSRYRKRPTIISRGMEKKSFAHRARRRPSSGRRYLWTSTANPRRLDTGTRARE